MASFLCNAFTPRSRRAAGKLRHFRTSPAFAISVATSALIAFVVAERPCSATEWRGYGQLEGQVAFMSGPVAPSIPSVTGGFQVSLGAGPQGVPLMLGLNVGTVALGSQTTYGDYGLGVTDGGLHLGRSSFHQDFSLAHIELALRLQPEWYRVRPFVEVAGGVGILGESDSLEEIDGTVDESRSRNQTAATSLSYALGIDIEPWKRRAPDHGSVGLAFTLGVRSTQFGKFDSVQPIYDASNSATWQPTSGSLHMWSAFIAVTLALESGPPAPEAPYQYATPLPKAPAE